MSLITRLVRWTHPVGAPRRVLRGPLRGSRFIVIPGMGATYALGQDHWHFAFLSAHVKPGMTVYDIGANCGQMALFFSRFVGNQGRVLSFEPVPQNAVILRQNLKLNHRLNVEVIETAVAADSQPKPFCFDAARHTMGTLKGSMVKLDQWDTTFEVPCVTLDEMVDGGSPPPALIKIDVEGAGWEVIQGAQNVIKQHRPLIYFEVHANTTESPELRAVAELKDKWGYRVTDLDGTLAQAPGPMWGAALWCEPVHG